MPSSYRRSGGGSRSISMRELTEMPFDQLANSVEAATTVSSSRISSVGVLPLLRGTAFGGSSGGSGGVPREPWLRSHSSLPLVHTSLRDTAYHHLAFDEDGAGGRGSRTSPRGPHTAADGGGPLGRLPLALAVVLDNFAQPTHGRPYTPGAASEGGRSSVPYNYEQLLTLDEGRMRRVVRPEVVRALPMVRAKRMAPIIRHKQTHSFRGLAYFR
ncbi:hypothetical protein Vafri_6073 [Volvox africanus]|nr:hypothetical protein Vafri_6073 [Volvox africanus]